METPPTPSRRVFLLKYSIHRCMCCEYFKNVSPACLYHSWVCCYWALTSPPPLHLDRSPGCRCPRCSSSDRRQQYRSWINKNEIKLSALPGCAGTPPCTGGWEWQTPRCRLWWPASRWPASSCGPWAYPEQTWPSPGPGTGTDIFLKISLGECKLFDNIKKCKTQIFLTGKMKLVS